MKQNRSRGNWETLIVVYYQFITAALSTASTEYLYKNGDRTPRRLWRRGDSGEREGAEQLLAAVAVGGWVSGQLGGNGREKKGCRWVWV